MIINRARDTFWDSPGDRWVMYLHDHLYQTVAIAAGSLVTTGSGIAAEVLSSNVDARVGGAALVLAGLGLAAGTTFAAQELITDIHNAPIDPEQLSTSTIASDTVIEN